MMKTLVDNLNQTPLTHTIGLIPCNYIGTVWNEIKPLLGATVTQSRDRWDIESLHKSFLNEQLHLWVAFDENRKFDGVAATEFIRYPRRKVLSVECLGGKNMHSWGWDMLDRFDSWAKDNGCDEIVCPYFPLVRAIRSSTSSLARSHHSHISG